MKQSTLLNIASSIALGLEETQTKEEKNLYDNLESVLNTITSYVSDGTADFEAPKTKTTNKKKTKSTEVLGATEDEAFELLKDESKPGPTLLKKTYGITTEAAVGLYKLVEKRIAEYKAEGKPTPKKGKKQDIKKVIAGLPKGSNLLVKAPFNLIAKLDEKYHAPYLAGLKLEDMISSDNLAAAAEEGYDDTLVKHIIKYADKKRPTPKKVVDATQYQDKIIEWTNAIPDGGDLFNHMSSAGLSKTVLANFRDIATAVSE